jgi:hypothetical protein
MRDLSEKDWRDLARRHLRNRRACSLAHQISDWTMHVAAKRIELETVLMIRDRLIDEFLACTPPALPDPPLDRVAPAEVTHKKIASR